LTPKVRVNEFHPGLGREVTKVTGVEDEVIMRKFIAVAAMSGSLALAGAGVIGMSGTAGAAAPTTTTTPATTPTPATPGSVTPAVHAERCAKAEKVAMRIAAREAKAAIWLPHAQAREAKASAAGHTKVAARIGGRISRVQKLEVKGDVLLAKIAAKCGSATSTTTS
jgi:hypothetical protein